MISAKSTRKPFPPVRQVGRHADAFWAAQWMTSNAFRMGSYHKLAIGYFAVAESFRSLDNNSKADCAKMDALEHRAIVIVYDFIIQHPESMNFRQDPIDNKVSGNVSPPLYDGQRVSN